MYGSKASFVAFAIIATGVAGMASTGLWIAKKCQDAGRDEEGEEPILTRFALSDASMNASVRSATSGNIFVRGGTSGNSSVRSATSGNSSGSSETSNNTSEQSETSDDSPAQGDTDASTADWSESTASASESSDPSVSAAEQNDPPFHAAEQEKPPVPVADLDEPPVHIAVQVASPVPAALQNLFNDAIAFCAEMYRNTVTDLHGEPYYEFATRLVASLTDAGVGNSDVLIASPLFGAVRNGTASVSDIARRFGHQVGWLVDEVAHAQHALLDAELAVEFGEESTLAEFYYGLSWNARLILFAQRVDALSAIWKAPPQGWSQREIDAYLQRARRAYFYVSDVNVELKKQFQAVWKEIWRGPEDYCASD